MTSIGTVKAHPSSSGTRHRHTESSSQANGKANGSANGSAKAEAKKAELLKKVEEKNMRLRRRRIIRKPRKKLVRGRREKMPELVVR